MKNKNIIQSIRCAFNGMKSSFKNERNFREYTVIALVFLLFNVLLSAEMWEYIVFFSLSGAVFSAEFINTAIEILTDKTDSSVNESNRLIKDTAAAGVLTMGIVFFIAEGMILIPKLIRILK